MMKEVKVMANSMGLIQQKISELNSPQNKIIKRLWSNLVENRERFDHTAGYSRMHHRHNRA